MINDQPKSLVIRPVDESGLPAAGLIHSVSWQESHRAFCAPDFVGKHTPERQTEYLRDKMKKGCRVFMLTGGEPAGIVSVTGNLIEDLYVLPGLQNRGYGTLLLRWAMKQCIGIPTLWILENNQRAACLYRREGFAETGRRNRITDGLDEVEFAFLPQKDAEGP